MPNIKSAEKRVLVAKANNARNKAAKTELKTSLKKFDTAVSEGNQEAAESAYKVAVKTVDKAATKGLIHKNNAAHKKSSLTMKLNGMAH
ncbi:MAG: 30S ribosomal protein S20 [Clostridiales bacterium]|nr:30S ribosomal protein S20 [Clostridiales bacterium]